MPTREEIEAMSDEELSKLVLNRIDTIAKSLELITAGVIAFDARLGEIEGRLEAIERAPAIATDV